MSRPRLPDAVKKAQGTFRADQASNDVNPTGECLPYKELKARTAATLYKKFVDIFTPLGCVGEQDSFHLKEMADLFIERQEVRENIKNDGGKTYWTQGTNGQRIMKAHPLLEHLKEMDKRYDSLCDKIGGNARARAALNNINSQTDANELILEIFGDKSNKSAQLDIFSMPMNAVEKPIN